MSRPKLKLFQIISRSGYEPKIGENLQKIMRDTIEDFDYYEMDSYELNFVLLNDIQEQIEFTKKHKNEIEKYKKGFLVVTTQKYIVLGFVRI